MSKQHDINMKILLGRKQAAECLVLPPNQKIVDVATGTGTLAYELAMLGHSVVGIDVSTEMLNLAMKKCSKNLDLSFEQADAAHLFFKNNKFDVASISFALHDMPYEDEIKVLQEMKRVTKPNGHILIVDYNEPRNHWAAKLAFPLIRASESTNWLPFINRGLESLIQEVNLRVSRRITYLGVIQIVVIDC